METRLKERLTGAAILVALIVVLVPEMFRGGGGEGDHDGPTGMPATTGSSGAEGPPLRSYTIDLSNNPKGSAPLQSNGDATAANPKSEPASPDASKVEPPRAEAPSEAPARPETAPTAPPKSAPTAFVRGAQAASGGASAGQPKAALAANTANASNWSVQLGLFAKRENAERLVNELKARGFTVAISGADPKGLFHVHSAGTSDRATAQALAQRLKGEGFQAVVAP